MKKINISVALKLSALFIIGIVIGFVIPGFKSDTTVVDNSGTLLWKITSDKQSSPSYLYGTIHLLPEEDFFMGQDAIDAFKSVKSLTMEVDIDMPLKEQIKLAQKIMLPKGTTLKDYMNKDDYSKFVSYLTDSLEIKESHIQRYFMIKPFNLLAFVCKDYYGNLKMYEQEFNKMAKKQKIPVNGLEDMDMQLNMMEESGVAMEVPEGNEIYMIDEFEKFKALYLKKDLDALNTFFKEEITKENSAVLEHKLITERNINWIPKLDSIMAAGPTFIAVGAGHLGGDKGVISLLREKGYTVTPVNK